MFCCFVYAKFISHGTSVTKKGMLIYSITILRIYFKLLSYTLAFTCLYCEILNKVFAI